MMLGVILILHRQISIFTRAFCNKMLYTSNPSVTNVQVKLFLQAAYPCVKHNSGNHSKLHNMNVYDLCFELSSKE